MEYRTSKEDKTEVLLNGGLAVRLDFHVFNCCGVTPSWADYL